MIIEALATATPYLASVALGIVRCIAGYLENVAGEKANFSLRQMAETIIRMFPQIIGLSALGLPEVSALFTDWIVVKVSNALKKKK